MVFEDTCEVFKVVEGMFPGQSCGHQRVQEHNTVHSITCKQRDLQTLDEIWFDFTHPSPPRSLVGGLLPRWWLALVGGLDVPS